MTCSSYTIGFEPMIPFLVGNYPTDEDRRSKGGQPIVVKKTPAIEALKNVVENYKDNIAQMADELANAGLNRECSELLVGAVDQLECIASAEELAGRTEWMEILDSLQEKSNYFATTVVDD